MRTYLNVAVHQIIVLGFDFFALDMALFQAKTFRDSLIYGYCMN